jgi:hypothetical protein
MNIKTPKDVARSLKKQLKKKKKKDDEKKESSARGVETAMEAAAAENAKINEAKRVRTMEANSRREDRRLKRGIESSFSILPGIIKNVPKSANRSVKKGRPKSVKRSVNKGVKKSRAKSVNRSAKKSAPKSAKTESIGGEGGWKTEGDDSGGKYIPKRRTRKNKERRNKERRTRKRKNRKRTRNN